MPDTRKYRRRQLYLGVFVLVLSCFSVTEGIYFRHQDAVQRQCIGDAFSDLSHTLTIRSSLGQRQTDATTNLILAVVDVKTRKEWERILLAYQQENEAIEKARKENPVPPYPEGKCDGS